MRKSFCFGQTSAAQDINTRDLTSNGCSRLSGFVRCALHLGVVSVEMDRSRVFLRSYNTGTLIQRVQVALLRTGVDMIDEEDLCLNWAFFLLCPPSNSTDLDGGGTSLSLSMSMMIKKCASVEWEYDAKQNLTRKVKHKQIIESQVCCWFQGLNWDSQWLEIATVAGKGFCWDVPWLSMSSNVGSATCHIFLK